MRLPDASAHVPATISYSDAIHHYELLDRFSATVFDGRGCRNRGVGIPPTGSPDLLPSVFLPRADFPEAVMAAETISSLVFTGPLAWTVDAACEGETSLYFAPPGERPEARALREAKARLDLHELRRARALPLVGPRTAGVRLLGWRVRRGPRRGRLPRRHAGRSGRSLPEGQRPAGRAPRAPRRLSHFLLA